MFGKIEHSPGTHNLLSHSTIMNTLTRHSQLAKSFYNYEHTHQVLTTC